MVIHKIVPGRFDLEMFPLIKVLNNCGIKTIASCCGHDVACAYIAIDMTSITGIRITDNHLVIDWHFRKQEANTETEVEHGKLYS